MYPIPTFPKIVRVARESEPYTWRERRDLHTMFEGQELCVSYEWPARYDEVRESVEHAAMEKLGREIISRMKIVETSEMPYQPEPMLAEFFERALDLAVRGWAARSTSNSKEWDEIQGLSKWLNEYKKHRAKEKA